MKYDALLLGSIGVLAETSELQRRAFNTAFDRFGIDWHWDREGYHQLLRNQGGRARIMAQAEADQKCDEVDVAAVYTVKRGAFRTLVEAEGLIARPGVRDLMSEAQVRGMKTGFVTSTAIDQVETILSGLRKELSRADFNYIGDRSRVTAPKPSPEIYYDALAELDVQPEQALAIEDTPESAEAALAAGVTVVGFPGCASRDRAFPPGVPVVEFLSASVLGARQTRIAAE